MTSAAASAASAVRRPSLFRQRNFAVYWAGGLVTSTGTWLQNVTASVVILSLTHSPLLVGVLNFATFAPTLLLSVPGGMLCDRFDRRVVVIVTQLASFAVAGTMTALSFAGQLSALWLIGLSMLLGSLYAVTKPAMSALIPSLVDRADIARANAVNTVQFSVGQLGGGALATALLAIGSPGWAFAANAASFLAPVAAMFALRGLARRGAPNLKRHGGTTKGGLRRVLGGQAVAPMLTAVALSGASLEVLRTLAPSIVSSGLHLPTNRAGVLITAYGVGWLAGLMTFGAASRRLSPSQMLSCAFMMQVVGVLGLSLAPTLVAAAASAAPIGLGFAFNIPALNAGIQQVTPDQLLGRAMAMFSISMIGLRPVFSLTAGALATAVGSRVAAGICCLFPLAALRLAAMTGRALRDAQDSAVYEGQAAPTS